MKLFIKILGGVSALSALAYATISYVGGRRGMPLSFNSLPAEIVPAIVGFCSFFALLILVAIASTKQRSVRYKALLAISFVLYLAAFFSSPTLFHFGFRERLKATVTADELRGIARACRSTLDVDEQLPGPQKRSLWTEEQHGPKWTTLTNSTALGKLDSWVVIFNRADSVELSWGGGLVGHWGVVIQNDGLKNSGDIAPGIATFNSN